MYKKPLAQFRHNRNRSFYGQNDVLAKMDEILLPVGPDNTAAETVPDSKLRVFALCGLGGLGKTEVAIEYMHRRKRSFDAIFWVDSADKLKLDAGYRSISIQLGLQSEEQALLEVSEVTRDLVKAWLINPVRSLNTDIADDGGILKWLLVFDNAEGPDLLYDFIPTDGSGSIIITSRDPFTKRLNLAGVSGVDLPSMSAEVAGSLLQKVSHRESEPGSEMLCTQIAERLGGLPLAIVQMANLIQIKHLSLSEFVEYYDSDAKKLQETSIPGLTADQTLTSVWNIESLSPAATALLQVLSMLDGDKIPEDVLTNAAEKVDLENYPKNKVDYFEARSMLLKSSLITRNIDLGFLRIHRLVQDVVRNKLTTAALRTIFDATAVLVSGVWPFLDRSSFNRTDRLRQIQRYISQLRSLRSILETVTTEVLDPNLAIVALFNEAAWWFFLNTTSWDTAMSYAELSQSVLQAKSDPEDENLSTKFLADAYRYQGIIATQMGDYLIKLAVPCIEKWISILVDRIEKYQEPEDIGTLPIAYNEYGIALMRIPDQKEAERSWAISCDSIRQVTKTGEAPFPMPWMNWSLVSAYSGDPDAGYSRLSPILSELQEKLGSDAAKTLNLGGPLNAMANICRRKGSLNEAYECSKKAVSLLNESSGKRSHWATQAHYQLAYYEYQRKNYQLSRELSESILTFCGETSWYRGWKARASWNLGHTLLEEGNPDNEDEGEILLQRAMEIRHELCPDDNRPEEDLGYEDWEDLVFYVHR